MGDILSVSITASMCPYIYMQYSYSFPGVVEGEVVLYHSPSHYPPCCAAGEEVVLKGR